MVPCLMLRSTSPAVISTNRCPRPNVHRCSTALLIYLKCAVHFSSRCACAKPAKRCPMRSARCVKQWIFAAITRKARGNISPHRNACPARPARATIFFCKGVGCLPPSRRGIFRWRFFWGRSWQHLRPATQWWPNRPSNRRSSRLKPSNCCWKRACPRMPSRCCRVAERSLAPHWWPMRACPGSCSPAAHKPRRQSTARWQTGRGRSFRSSPKLVA